MKIPFFHGLRARSVYERRNKHTFAYCRHEKKENRLCLVALRLCVFSTFFEIKIHIDVCD